MVVEVENMLVVKWSFRHPRRCMPQTQRERKGETARREREEGKQTAGSAERSRDVQRRRKLSRKKRRSITLWFVF